MNVFRIRIVFLLATAMMIVFPFACSDSTETNDAPDENETVFILDSAYFTEGFYFANAGDYKNAISSFDKAIELKPDYAEVYYNRGYIYLKLEQYSTAINDFSEVISLNPSKNQTLIMTYFNRGTSYNRLEEYEKGINDYSKAIELNPDFVEAYYYRGNAYIKLREYAKALVDYNAAIAINPNYQNAINNRKILLESGVLIKD